MKASENKKNRELVSEEFSNSQDRKAKVDLKFHGISCTKPITPYIELIQSSSANTYNKEHNVLC